MAHGPHDPDWILAHMGPGNTSTVGADRFSEELGPVYHIELPDRLVHRIRTVVVGSRITSGDTDPAAIHELLKAVGLGADPDAWLVADRTTLGGAA